MMDFEQIDLQWFAAEEEGRTEEPSEYKLKKAREEGQLPKSQELSSAIVLFVTVIVLIIAAPFHFRWCCEVLRFYFMRVTEQSLIQPGFYRAFIFALLKMVLPLAISGIVAGITANIVQNKGFLFTTKTIEPQFSKIVPKVGQYLKKTLFSFEGAFNVGKSLFKVFAVSSTAFVIIRMNLPKILY
ncbi:MAG: EscU/YscU/HrcU family type III secretion system export apparatus switch protein, partial [Treponema sp.]|nr:EscU/YscU/HrcU family type III secretion system export apparatus switch protein [Treponema sp.]